LERSVVVKSESRRNFEYSLESRVLRSPMLLRWREIMIIDVDSVLIDIVDYDRVF